MGVCHLMIASILVLSMAIVPFSMKCPRYSTRVVAKSHLESLQYHLSLASASMTSCTCS